MVQTVMTSFTDSEAQIASVVGRVVISFMEVRETTSFMEQRGEIVLTEAGAEISVMEGVGETVPSAANERRVFHNTLSRSLVLKSIACLTADMVAPRNGQRNAAKP